MASPLPLVARQDVDDEHEHDDGDDYAQRRHVYAFESVDDDSTSSYIALSLEARERLR
jgi:hypothetical protein